MGFLRTHLCTSCTSRQILCARCMADPVHDARQHNTKPMHKSPTLWRRSQPLPPVSSHVHRESPSMLRRCTSPSLSLSLSLSALLPGSIGLLLMCLLTSVRRLGVADARNQSRPELGERERHKAPCCEARSFPRRSESGGESDALSLSTCLSVPQRK